jgi:DNA damage-binding protein 1
VVVYNLTASKDDLSNSTSQPDLVQECVHTSQMMTLYLKVKGDSILVGDLVRSMTLLRYKPADKALQEVARDLNSCYMRAVEIMDGSSTGAAEDVLLGTDIAGNLFSMRQQSDAASDEERARLEMCGEYGVGDYLNCFRRGTLVGQPIEASASSSAPSASASAPASAYVAAGDSSILSPNYASITGQRVGGCSSVLFGGVSGLIGTIFALSEDSFRFFHAVEKVLRRVTVPVGGLSYRDWRSFHNDLRSSPQRNMIDGDLVESLLLLAESPSADRAALDSIAREINDEINASIASMGGVIGYSKAGIPVPVSTSSPGELLGALAVEKVNLSLEDIVHRIEDISRLH